MLSENMVQSSIISPLAVTRAGLFCVIRCDKRDQTSCLHLRYIQRMRLSAEGTGTEMSPQPEIKAIEANGRLKPRRKIMLVDSQPVVGYGLKMLFQSTDDLELTDQATCVADALTLLKGGMPVLVVSGSFVRVT